MSEAAIGSGGDSSGTSVGAGVAAGGTAPATDQGGSGVGGNAGGTGSTNSDWTVSLNDDLKGYVQNKGFKDPASALESYRNLEKLMGAPKERLLKLPEKAEDPAWSEIWGKLGRPEKPEEYNIPMPEGGGDKEFAEWAKGTFHKLGISKAQAETLVKEWNGFSGNQSKAAQDAATAKNVSDDKALKAEWGQAYEQHTNLAKRAVKEFGVDGETIDKLEKALGFAGVMKHFHSVGSKLGEAAYVSGNSGGGFGNVLAPAAARNQIETLRGDPDFVRRYTSGDPAAKAKMDQLHQMAFPDDQVG